MANREDHDYLTGEQLLAGFPKLQTREQKLEQACKALMLELELIHVDCKEQSLQDNLTNPEVYCSCADAYRMGHAALKA